jgi:hypothetical protein
MAGLLKLYLIITGIGAAISVLMPALVVIGLFLIVPGLILAVMPTAFLWGCVFAVIWFPLHGMIGDALATAAALIGAATLLWIVPQASRAVSATRLAGAIRADVLPATPIMLKGHVRIDMVAQQIEPFDPAHPAAPRPVRCNALCAAALFTDGVETVTLNPLGYGPLDEAQAIGEATLAANARTFRLVPRDRCTETLRPTDAGGLGADLDEIRALEAYWNLRLSTRDCIVSEPTRATHDMVIAEARYTLFGGGLGYGWDLGPRGVEVSRIEVRTGGKVLLRKLIATTQTLARPLWIGAGGSLESFHFGWERKPFSNAPRYGSFDGNKLLREHSNLAAHADPGAIAGLVRERLAAMLADQRVTATDPGWAAAGGYFRALKPGTITNADRALLPALVRDRRMTWFDGMWQAIRGLGDEGTLLRAPMVERLADPGPGDQDETVRILGNAIGTLPPGTFAQQTPVERALLADPVARLRARGVVARLSDRGAGAVPDLLEIVDYHARAWAVARADPKRRPSGRDNGDLVIVDAARVAFCRLGAEGAAALPRLMALDRAGLLQRGISRDREWTMALARLGQPIESFAKPENLSGTTEQFHANLRRRLENFRPDRDCQSTFT